MGLFVNDGAYDALLRGFTDAYVASTGLSGDDFFALCKGIIARESRFQPTAYHLDGPDPVLDTSYGLMQVEGRTAQAFGFAGDLKTGLYDPGTNLLLGVRIIADNLATASGNVPAAVSAYNAGFSAQRPGDGKRNADGQFVNQAYVDAVLGYMQQYQAQATSGGNTVTAAAGVLALPDLAAVPWWAWLALLVGGAAVAKWGVGGR
jgi:hypothetical protein